jgi:N6-adenosine-specific RNA methylase IME4
VHCVRCAGAFRHVERDRPRPKPAAALPDLSAAIIATLPVRDIVARNAWLHIWWRDAHLPPLIETMEAFGFAFRGKGFTWVKTLKSFLVGHVRFQPMRVNPS